MLEVWKQVMVCLVLTGIAGCVFALFAGLVWMMIDDVKRARRGTEQ